MQKGQRRSWKKSGQFLLWYRAPVPVIVPAENLAPTGFLEALLETATSVSNKRMFSLTVDISAFVVLFFEKKL